MRLLALGILAAAGSAVAAGAAAPREKTMFLVGVPAIGNVCWRCDGGSDDRFGLTFRAFHLSASDHLVLRVRRRMVRRATVHPGETLRLPYVRGRRQELRIVQATGAGILRATLTVEFVRERPLSYSWPYAPPKLTLRVFPR